MLYYTNYLYPSLRDGNQSRYVGLFWPFVGGLLLGGLVGNNIGDNKPYFGSPQGSPTYPYINQYPPYNYGPIYYPSNSNVPNPSYYINPYQPTNVYVDSETNIAETPMYSYPPYNYL